MSVANLERYQEHLKLQDQNITFYLRHRIRLLQLLGDLRHGRLESLDAVNDTLISLEKRKLALQQHLRDLDTDYAQVLRGADVPEDGAGSDDTAAITARIAVLTDKLKQINRFRSDLSTINRVVKTQFEEESIRISKAKIQDLFKLENSEDYQLIFRKGELVDAKNEIYKFNKIEFSKNLKELSEALRKERQSCEDLKVKIEHDRLQWMERQRKFSLLYTGLQ